MTKATKRVTGQWMLHLMARQAPQSVDDAKAAVALSVAALMARYPAEVFCQASMDAVAAAERYWSEAGTIKALDAWRLPNAPADVTALPPEAEAAPLPHADKLWVALYYRAESDEAAVRALDLIRAKDDAAFTYLANTSPIAARAAVLNRWFVPGQNLAAEWDDEAGIRRLAHKIATEVPGRIYGDPRHKASLQRILLERLARVVKMHAPRHGPAMFEELHWLASGGAAEQAREPPVEITHSLWDIA